MKYFIEYDSTGRVYHAYAINMGAVDNMLCPGTEITEDVWVDCGLDPFGRGAENIYVELENGFHVLPRPTQATTLANQTLNNYPEGSIVEIKGEQYPLDGSDVTLAFDLPGDYPIKVVCWPYLDFEGVIHVD